MHIEKRLGDVRIPTSLVAQRKGFLVFMPSANGSPALTAHAAAIDCQFRRSYSHA